MRKSIIVLMTTVSALAVISVLAIGRRTVRPEVSRTLMSAQAGANPRRTASGPVTEIPVTEIPVSSTRPALKRNALNTPPEILNAVEGVLVESQEIQPLSDSVSMLTLRLKNVSAKPIAHVVFARQREPVTSLVGADFSSADFTSGVLFQPGAEVTYRFSLTNFERPLVARVAAVVYADASGEGDELVKGTYAARYVVYNAELASLLTEVRGAVARARASGTTEADAARDFAADLKRRSDAINNDANVTAEKKLVYSEYARVIGTFGQGGDGLSAFAAKLAELLRDRPTRLPQPAASQ